MSFFRSREAAAAEALAKLNKSLDDAEYTLDVKLKETLLPESELAMTEAWQEVVDALVTYEKSDPIVRIKIRMFNGRKKRVENLYRTIARFTEWISNVRATALDTEIDNVMGAVSKPLKDLEALMNEAHVLSTAESLLGARERADVKNNALDQAFAAQDGVSASAENEDEIQNLINLAAQQAAAEGGRAAHAVPTTFAPGQTTATAAPPTAAEMRAAQIVRTL